MAFDRAHAALAPRGQLPVRRMRVAPLGGSLADVRAARARAARERRASSTGRSRGCRPTGRPPTGPKRNHGPGSRHDARHAQAFHALSWLSSPTEPADSSRQRASSMSRRVAARHRANVSRQDAAKTKTTAITSTRCIIGPPPLIARGRPADGPQGPSRKPKEPEARPAQGDPSRRSARPRTRRPPPPQRSTRPGPAARNAAPDDANTTIRENRIARLGRRDGRPLWRVR